MTLADIVLAGAVSALGFMLAQTVTDDTLRRLGQGNYFLWELSYALFVAACIFFGPLWLVYCALKDILA